MRFAVLETLVECRTPKPNDLLTATGIPPHVMLLNNLNQISNNVALIIPAVEKSTRQSVAGLEHIIEERAMVANTVTREGLMDIINNSLSEVLNRHGIFKHRDEDNNTDATPIINDTADRYPTFYYNNRHHMVPSDFKFPSVTLRVLFQYWMDGDNRLQYSPFRRLQPLDLPDKVRKRLCGLQKALDRTTNYHRSG